MKQHWPTRDHVDLLSLPDAVMDPDVGIMIDNYITGSLREAGWDPSRPDIPDSAICPSELEAIRILIRGYQGLAESCQLMGMWCRQLEEVYETFVEASGLEDEESKRADLTGRSARGLPFKKGDALTPADYLTEGLCLLFAQEFDPYPYRHLLASHEGSWSPPAFYWTLLKDPKVVETVKRIYDRNRGSEFLSAFLQDFCERHESVDDDFRVSSKSQLSEITAHFAIFTKAFRELLVEFLVEDDLFEFGDRDPHNISRLLCHAENAYLYAQALLHFLPYSHPEFASCRRLAQLIFRNLRETKREYATADRLLLFTALPNYPNLCRLFEPLQETDEDGRMNITRATIVNICDALARVVRRFEKHKTLLLFHDVSSPIPRIADEEGELEPLPLHTPNVASAWEAEMLREERLSQATGSDSPLVPAELEIENSEGTLEFIQAVEWPVTAEIRSKAQLPVFWNLPSASQAGDDEVIEDEAQDESDRRGSTKLILPPMEAIRETMLLDRLWECLVCPGLPGQPVDMPVGKLVELILMLSTYSDYELVVMHLQQEQHDLESSVATDTLNEAAVFTDDYLSEVEPQHDFQDDAIYGVSPSSDVSDDEEDTHTQTRRPQQPVVSITLTTSNVEADDRKRLPDATSSALEDPAHLTAARARKKARLEPSSVVSSYLTRSVVPSVLESNIYKDPHEGSKLRALRPDKPEQSARLKRMFELCAEKTERYKGRARQELFDLYYLIREPRSKDETLSDAFVCKLLLRLQTSAGASAVVRFVEETLLPYNRARLSREGDTPQEFPVDPVNRVTPALQSLLMRICIWHPRKRVLVIALFKKILEESFNGPTSATPQTQAARRRLISVAVSQLGLSDTPPLIPPEDFHSLPWRAAEADWAAVVSPGYKLVFHLVRELLPCFDLTILRETLDFILGVCGAPFSPPFAQSLCDLLRAVALQNCFDFNLNVNANLKKAITEFLENIYGTWAPHSPPTKVLQQCQFIAETIGLPPESMPIVKQFEEEAVSDSFESQSQNDDDEDSCNGSEDSWAEDEDEDGGFPKSESTFSDDEAPLR